MIAALVLIVFGQAQKVQDPAKKEVVPPAMMVDPRWEPKIGDAATFYHPDIELIPFTTEILTYKELEKIVNAGDSLGYSAMLKRADVDIMPRGAGMLILEIHTNQFLAKFQFIEARILEGPMKGKKAYVDTRFVARLIPIPPEPPQPKVKVRPTYRPSGKPVDPAIRAMSLMKLADNLENEGKREGAVDYYRQVVKEFPRRPEAKKAAARIKVLTGK